VTFTILEAFFIMSKFVEKANFGTRSACISVRRRFKGDDLPWSHSKDRQENLAMADMAIVDKA
jgi:hypothetical protein